MQQLRWDQSFSAWKERSASSRITRTILIKKLGKQGPSIVHTLTGRDRRRQHCLLEYNTEHPYLSRDLDHRQLARSYGSDRRQALA